MEDRFLLHWRDSANWRLRNIKKVDPSWELGLYSICHPYVRPKIDEGDRVFDVVVNDEKNPVIRSAFVITKAKDICGSRVLYFDEFYFADEKPIELPGHYLQYRQMKMQTYVKKYGDNSIWDRIVKTYTRYKKGDRPKKIDEKSWNRMITEASKIREERK